MIKNFPNEYRSIENAGNWNYSTPPFWKVTIGADAVEIVPRSPLSMGMSIVIVVGDLAMGVGASFLFGNFWFIPLSAVFAALSLLFIKIVAVLSGLYGKYFVFDRKRAIVELPRKRITIPASYVCGVLVVNGWDCGGQYEQVSQMFLLYKENERMLRCPLVSCVDMGAIRKASEDLVSAMATDIEVVHLDFKESREQWKQWKKMKKSWPGR